MTEQQILQKQEALTKKMNVLNDKLAKRRAGYLFECACGRKHRIRECEAIQSHAYVPPSGCSDGDYWVTSTLYILCPAKPSIRNRMLFNYSRNSELSYEQRNRYEHNPEKQFIRIYSPLFKSIMAEHDHDSGSGSRNNYFIDTHRVDFGLCY